MSGGQFTGRVDRDKCLTREEYLRGHEGLEPKAPSRPRSGPAPKGVGDWWRHGLCSPGGKFHHLPWLNLEHVPDNTVRMMVAVCLQCPSFDACKADMEANGDNYGVRAGVVWADGKPAPSKRRSRIGGWDATRLPGGQWLCVWCGEAFESEGRSPRRKYCSQTCFRDGVRELKREWMRKRRAG